MTNEQRERITSLREKGYGYTTIAQMIGVSDNSVKSFCRRNNLAGNRATVRKPKEGEHICLYCGVPVEQNPKRKEKKFCSAKCRNIWWNSHLDKVSRKAYYSFICPQCKKPFMVYGNAKRKYCCHECYIAARFGGGLDEKR